MLGVTTLLILVVTCIWFFRSRPPTLPQVSLENKVAIITGANAGLGKTTAINLAKMKATVILACRSKERGEAAADDIIKKTGNPNVRFMQLDLASLDSVRKFAVEFRATKLPCHILINNAGVFYLHSSVLGNSPTVTPDGFNMQFISNYLGHFLLTLLLLDILDQNAARIINVSSVTHKLTSLDFDDLQGNNCSHFIGYSRSKLAQIYFTYELQRRLNQSNSKAKVFAVHPGILATDIVSYMGSIVNGLMHFIFDTLLNWTADTGAFAELYAAVSPSLEQHSGVYLSQWNIAPSSSISYDQDIAKKLWQLSEKMTKIAQ